MIFEILNHLKAKISTSGTVRRAGRYQRCLRAPAGRLDVGIAAPEAGFRFRANQSRGRRAGTYAAPKAAGAAEAAADSCGELRRWDPPSTGSTDLGCTINICKAALCVDITFGNSFAESPSSRFKLPLATCKSEKQAAGWRLGECAPCGMLRGPLAPPLEVPCVPCLKVHRY